MPGRLTRRASLTGGTALLAMPRRAPRTIFCLDLDAFFASVEILDDPQLDDPQHPIAVGSPDPRRGVISTASYAARRFGVRSGMPTVEALRRCPHLHIVPPRHERYAELSARVFAICRALSPQLEITSIDEGFLDVSAYLGPSAEARQLAAELRTTIQQQTGIAASIGIGSGKRIAKIACDRAKPDGILEIPRGAEREFLAPLPVGVISGIGPKTSVALAAQGIRRCRDLATTDAGHLMRWFGPGAAWMRAAAAGIDEDPVEPLRPARSISAESTIADDSADVERIGALVVDLADELARRLRADGRVARGVTLKLKDSDFRTITRAAKIRDGSDDPAVIAAAVAPLLRREASGRRFRLVGLAATHLVDGEQLTLFGRTPTELPAAAADDPH